MTDNNKTLTPKLKLSVNKSKKLTLGAKTTGNKLGIPKQNVVSGKKTITVEVKKNKFRPNTNRNANYQGQNNTNNARGGLSRSEMNSRMQALKAASGKSENIRANPLSWQQKPDSKPTTGAVEAEANVNLPTNNEFDLQKTPARHRDKAKDKEAKKTTNFSGKSTVNSDSEREKAPAKEIKNQRGRGEELRRQSSKININALNLVEEEQERVRSLASIKRQRQKIKREQAQPTEKIYREVTLPETITVQELASRMTERATDVIKELMKLGVLAKANQIIDADTAEVVIETMGHTAVRVADSDVENLIADIDDQSESLKPRPPVVTIMGHVDHGKTSLLDALRQTSIASGEAGGITQHIGAYQVDLGKKQLVTFLDTPGHKAFTAMRARGAGATDVVILVVAADDGIMAQTKEAISHAKAAKAPIIVAINKIDRPQADINRVKNELLVHELIPEDMGGDVMVVPVSAKERTNLNQLLETILLQAEIMELKANPERVARGVVIESRLDSGRGNVATVLIQKGSLAKDDIVVAGGAYGKVRLMLSDQGRQLDKAGPSQPVEIVGLNGTPDAGEIFAVVDTEKKARDIVEYRQEEALKQKSIVSKKANSLEDLFAAQHGQAQKQLTVVIKADVQGSIEAITSSLQKLGNEQITVNVLHTAVGGINESDVTLSSASNAIIVGFNVRPIPAARKAAEAAGVDIRYYSIIYDLIDDIKAAMSGMLSPIEKLKYIGSAEIRQVFSISRVGKVAGCYVTDGIIKRGCNIKLLRDNVVVCENTLKTLRRFKDDVKEVKSNFECGIVIDNYDDIKVGDTIEA
ncbi:MAG: translation initiation factor IF-2, partial [Pseudomonadota bacterium]